MIISSKDEGAEVVTTNADLALAAATADDAHVAAIADADLALAPGTGGAVVETGTGITTEREAPEVAIRMTRSGAGIRRIGIRRIGIRRGAAKIERRRERRVVMGRRRRLMRTG